jgi:hypothetical protein
MINNINTLQNYLGITWTVSIFNIIFAIPTAACLIALTFSSYGFPYEFMLENWGLFAYISIAFSSSVMFMFKYKSLEFNHVKAAFSYSLAPNISMALFVLFILFISSKPVVMAFTSQ